MILMNLAVALYERDTISGLNRKKFPVLTGNFLHYSWFAMVIPVHDVKTLSKTISDALCRMLFILLTHVIMSVTLSCSVRPSHSAISDTS